MDGETNFLDQIVYGLQDMIDWIINNPIETLLLLLLFLLLLLLLSAFKEALSNHSSSSGGYSGSSDDDYFSRHAAQRELERQQAEQAKLSSLQELLEDLSSQDPETREIASRAMRNMMAQVGLDHLQPQQLNLDPTLLKKLASQLSLDHILGYSLAKQIELPEIETDTLSEREPSFFPTMDADVILTDDPGLILQASPEDLYDLDEAIAKLEQGELPVVVYYENKTTYAVLLLLVDISHSMDENLNNGIKRYVVAQAVLQKLLARAILGQAKYLLRFFDGSVHTLHQAMTPQQADILSKTIARQNFSGGGTDIQLSLDTGIADIKTSSNMEITKAQILLITDGEDNSLKPSSEIRSDLGEINLHLILIGGSSNPRLESAATSVQRFS
jgi:uncharacterized protein with von Willebrand factor type A (vWA) domain